MNKNSPTPTMLRPTIPRRRSLVVLLDDEEEDEVGEEEVEFVYVGEGIVVPPPVPVSDIPYVGDPDIDGEEDTP